MAGRRDIAAGTVGWRYGRRTDLRERSCIARCGIHRWHDGRLVASALRVPGQSVERDNKPRERCQPRGLRYKLETAGHDRVGITYAVQRYRGKRKRAGTGRMRRRMNVCGTDAWLSCRICPDAACFVRSPSVIVNGKNYF